MTNKDELVILFSGGTDSTYTAVMMKQKYKKIHLLTFDRFGFLNTVNSRSAAQALKEKFGKDKFTHQIIIIDELFKKISYNNYFRELIKYKFFVLLTCGLCKLAMHWRTIVYCIDNHIEYVCDGSSKEMIDPSQDAEIIRGMRVLYNEFGIRYFNPVFYAARQIREKTIFDLGISPVQYTKWTRFS